MPKICKKEHAYYDVLGIVVIVVITFVENVFYTRPLNSNMHYMYELGMHNEVEI